MALHGKQHEHRRRPIASVASPLFARSGAAGDLPHAVLPEHPIQPDTAAQLIADELMLDGNARLNLATFVSTWMEPQARELMMMTFDKNMIDKDEYPRTAEIEMRCVSMLSRLWNSPDHEQATGCSTTGSSEAAMLAGMALKWRWRDRMRAQGKSVEQPNMVMGANVQVCWEKFARYWDVEARLHVPVAAELLPAHLDVDAHDQVRLVGRLSRLAHPLPPAPLQSQAAQHAGLARAGRGAAGGLLVVGRVPHVGQDAHAARLDLGRLGILVLVDHVLVGRLRHQTGRDRGHVGGDERC